MGSMFVRLALLILFSLFIDLLNVLGFRQLLKSLRGSTISKLFFRTYWLIGVGLLIYFVSHFLWIGYPGLDYEKYRSFFFLFGIYMLIYFPRLVFVIFVIFQFIYNQIKALFNPKAKYRVKRKTHPKLIFLKLGIIIGFMTFGSVLYGILIGKSDFIVRNEIIYFHDLPSGFDGFRIAQISDMHLGSFSNPKDVKKGLELLRQQQVDLILFTGDMVNNVANEVDSYVEDFKMLKSSFGMYSILGNHDMGDYVKWKQADLKYQEIKKLIAKENAMGFTMLLNQNKMLYRAGDSITLIGVENWGKPPFKQYGNLQKAIAGVENVPFKILMSHDPSHFSMEVKEKTDIQLTLAGHTHGMQLGINCCGFKFSPAQWIYPLWNGLYQYNNQFLYVNPGFGFIGMPARIGIRPEITIITLKKGTPNE